MLTIQQKNLTLFGYISLGASFLGYYAIYLDSSNQTSSLWTWGFSFLLGFGILSWKNLQFSGREQGILVGLDFLFILNFYLATFWQNDFGLNYIVAGVVGGFLATYIYYKYL